VSASPDSTIGAADGAGDQTRPKRRILLGQVAAPVRAYLVTEAGSAGLLLAATVVALVWANSPWSDAYTSLWHTELGIRVGDWNHTEDLRHWVNDGLMVLFFFVVGLEVRREISVGELTNRRRLVVPTLGALFGLLVPAALFLAVNPSGDAAHGWGVAIGTDTAFVLGVLALVGPSCPTQLRVFLLTLSIADDVLAVSVIGIFYSASIDPWGLLVALLCLALLAMLGRLHTWRASVYVLALVVLWVATIESGLHPTIAGMAAGLAVTAYPPRRDVVERAASRFRAFRQSPLASVGRSAQLELSRAVSVNERLQAVLHPWTSFVIVPLFALANAGVDLRGGLLGDALTSPITWGVVLGLVVGKLVGVGVASLGAVRLGLGPLPKGVGSGQVVAGAALCGIGFTVSLLIADLAFERPAERDEAIVGVLLAGVIATGLGWVLFELAARLRGERTAGLPMVLDDPVDPERDHIRFGFDAPMTLVEYGDFECPFCGKATGVVRELYERFGDELRYVFRHLPLQDVHDHAELAAQAAEAAGAQGRFWEYHDLLFHHQEQLEWEDLLGYAADLDLDVERFARELAAGVHAERVRRDVASAEASGARGTPTFFVGERRHVGAYDARTLAQELEESRAAAPTAPAP
jgi:Na+/H+ antiporter NhaA